MSDDYTDFDLDSQYEDRYTNYLDDEYFADEYIPSGCSSCGTDNDELDYEENDTHWRLFCPYCDKTISAGEHADTESED